MKFSVIILLSFTMALWAHSMNKFFYNQGINITPRPESISRHDGRFFITNDTKVVILNSTELKETAEYFIGKISVSSGIKMEIKAEFPAGNYIFLIILQELDISNEGYIFKAGTKGITISAKTVQGIFYGMQTLMQLLPAEIESRQKIPGIEWSIPCVTVKDKPAFSWRGMHLDAGRHFFSVDFIKKQLDVLAMLKINKFHWHLTEDQGWRIEIKKYPKLAEIGSKRIEGDGSVYSGYYTQEQIKEVIDYAAERFIDVIPEIEMPGHSLAALSAYPEFSCTGGPFKPRIYPGIERDVYCAGNDKTFEFLENILAETAQLFPYKYIHIGGDECPKDRWNACPKCQARMKEEKLKDAHELQSYFMKRIEKILQKYGKKMIGWDEILEGGLAPSAAVMSWQGEKGGITAANMGHDVIMTPVQKLYFNKFQGDPKIEPVSQGGYTLLEDVYNYHPVPAAVKADRRKHILGAQACLWTEYMYSEELAEYHLYPRLAALAEITWSAQENKDYNDFLRRMNNQFVRLDMHGINYHIPLPEGPVSNIAFVDTVSLKFKTRLPAAKMVYTIDGSMPEGPSAEYSGALFFEESTMLKIASVLPHGKMSTVREIKVEKQQYAQPENPADTKQGLKVKTAKGYFLKAADIDTAENWKEFTVDSMHHANIPYDYVYSVDEDNFKAAIIEGFIDIPETGIYFFSSDQEQVWIAGRLVINNEGEVKRFSRRDGSIALSAGKHKLKIIYLNNLFKNWPSDWYPIQLRYRKSDWKEYKIVTPEMCWYRS